MHEVILRTEGLTKRFGSFQAVTGLNLEVWQEDIYGFLGLNGAGKTTTIRMLLSLIKPSAGKIYLYGQDISKSYLKIMPDIGALVEIPAFYSYLSGRANLNLLARLAGLKYTRDKINQLLDWVGLTGRADDKVRTYSQGMRQRLGIAQALLPVTMRDAGCRMRNNPLVILDEPTNGLDPQGIVHIRNLIKRLNREYNITFLISSHLLPEMELVCNRVGVIKEGKLIIQGKIQELVAQSAGEYNLKLKAQPLDSALGLINHLTWIEKTELVPDKEEIYLKCPLERWAELNCLLVNSNIRVSELTPIVKRLEEYFIPLVGDSSLESRAEAR